MDPEAGDHVLALLRWARWQVEAHRVVVGPDPLTSDLRREGDSMAVVLSPTQQQAYRARPEDARGNVAVVQAPEWDVSDPLLLRAVVDPVDPLRCVAQAVGPSGTAQLVFRCDADLGEGVRQLVGTADIEITAGEAVTIALEAEGAPTDQS